MSTMAPRTVRKASSERLTPAQQAAITQSLDEQITQGMRRWGLPADSQAGGQQGTARGSAPQGNRAQQWARQRTEAAKAAARERATRARKAAVASARREARSLYHRNRQVLAPWLLAAPYAGLGELAAFGASQPGTAPAAAAGIAAAGAGAWSGLAWWKKRPTQAKWHTRLKAGLAAGCAWCTGMPLLAPALGEPTMWAAALTTTAALSAGWWAQHRPGYPTTPPAQPADESLDTTTAAEICQTWADRVAIDSGAVPGSQLRHTRDLTGGTEFEITLSHAKGITQDSLTERRGRIGLALGIMAGQITFEPHGSDPAKVWMRVTRTAPDGKYAGPECLRNGKPMRSPSEIRPGDTVDIVVGPYQDGESCAVFRVLSSGSVEGGFVLGSRGSGKSLLLEQLAIGLRWLGCQVWYYDGQGGASSATLTSHADWALTDPERDAVRLYQALSGLAQARQGELKHDKSLANRYDYDANRPPLVVIVDECHELYSRVNPVTGRTFGADLGDLDRQYRKLGIGTLAASQDLDLNTFGQSDVLRAGLYAGTALTLRFMSKSHAALLPGAERGGGASPTTLPPGGGYGYTPLGERPTAMWRARKVEDPAGWMDSLPPVELDRVSALGAGHDYLDRHETAYSTSSPERLERIRAATTPEELRAALGGGHHQPGPASAAAAGEADGGAQVLRMPLAAGTASTDDAGGDGDEEEPGEDGITGRQRSILWELRQQTRTAASLAEWLGVTDRTVRTDLTALKSAGLIETNGRGNYRARA